MLIHLVVLDPALIDWDSQASILSYIYPTKNMLELKNFLPHSLTVLIQSFLCGKLEGTSNSLPYHQLISSIKAVISLLEPFFEKADLKWLQLSSLVVCYFHSQTFWIRAVPSTFGKITKISDPKKSKGKKYLDSLIDTFQSRKLHPLVTLLMNHYHVFFRINIFE